MGASALQCADDCGAIASDMEASMLFIQASVRSAGGLRPLSEPSREVQTAVVLGVYGGDDSHMDLDPAACALADERAIAVAMAGAIAVITVFVIPAFSGVFERLGDDLPWQTRALIATSDIAVRFWPLIVGLAAVAAGVFKYWSNSPVGAVQWDRIRIQLPLVGSIFERIALARFAKTFAIMGRSGVPVVRSLVIVAEVVGNRYVGAKILGMSAGVNRGESLYLTAQRSGIFLPLVLQMIAVGEESGNLPDLLDEVSEFYDGEVEYDLGKLVESIEPILIMFIAILVLVLALGVFLPIWDLGASS